MVSEDLENLLKLFDYALSSDNPAVKKALKNLLLVVSIVEPEEDASRPGPLTQIQQELARLRADISMLQNSMRSTTYPSYPSYPTTNPYNPNNGIWNGTLPPTWTSSNSTSANTTSTNSIDETEILKYISSMLVDDQARFTNKDLT